MVDGAELNRISDAIAKNPHLHVEIFSCLKEDGVKFRQTDDGVSMDLATASESCLKEISNLVKELQEEVKSQKSILDPLQEKLRKRMRDLHRRMSQHKRSAPAKERDDEGMPTEDTIPGNDEDLLVDKELEEPDMGITEEENVEDEGDEDENHDIEAEDDIDIDDMEAPLIEVDEDETIDDDDDEGEDDNIDEVDDMNSTIHREELESIDTKAFTLPASVKSKTMKELLYQYKQSMKDWQFGTDEEFEDFVNHVSK